MGPVRGRRMSLEAFQRVTGLAVRAGSCLPDRPPGGAAVPRSPRVAGGLQGRRSERLRLRQVRKFGSGEFNQRLRSSPVEGQSVVGFGAPRESEIDEGRPAVRELSKGNRSRDVRLTGYGPFAKWLSQRFLGPPF